VIRKALFIGDCYRPEQAANIDALFRIFAPLCNAFDIKTSKYISIQNHKTLNESNLTLWKESLLKQTDSELHNFSLHETIVFAFEISVVDIDFLNKNDITWLSFSIHPLRFLDDLYFDIKSNLEIDFSNCNSSHARIEMCVQALYSRYRLKLSHNSQKSLCIIGQTPFDKSVFIDGEFKSLTNYAKNLDEICTKYNKIYYKPHPHLSCSENNNFIRERYKSTDVNINNLYAFLIANPNMSVCAISSSVLDEAAYFGNKIHSLKTTTNNKSLPIDYRKLISDSKLWQSVFKKNSIGQHNDLKEVIPQNFLRNFFNSWSFQSELNDIVNDINYLTSTEYTKINQFNELKSLFNDTRSKFILFDEKLNQFTLELNSVSSEFIKDSQNTKKIFQDSKIISEDAKMISEDAKMISEDAKMISEDAKMISEDAKMISDGAVRVSSECRKLSTSALEQVDLSNEISKKSLITANESISQSLNALEHIEDFQTEFKQIRSKFIWFLLKSYGKFEKYIFKKYRKSSHK
jgi:hypothetical protein